MWNPKILSISSQLEVVFSAFTRGIPEEIRKASGTDVFNYTHAFSCCTAHVASDSQNQTL